MIQSQKFTPIFIRLIQLNGLFLGLQCLFILSTAHTFIQTLPLPKSIYIELIGTGFIHMGLYILLSLLQAALCVGVTTHCPKRPILPTQYLIWITSVIAILSANARAFPLSVFSRVITIPTTLLDVILITSLVMLSALLLFAVVNNQLVRLGLRLAFIPMCLCCMALSPETITPNNARPPSPHLIIIGIDSLPPNAINAQNTPTITQFINHSVHFKNTISPLARTYPAWTSILTGLYPLHHHARYNLMPANLVTRDKSIAWALRARGYDTLFATDDRRFNSIDKDFGFQQIVGPQLGVNDLLLGTFNDLPLGNLLVNTPIGRTLFPYNHMNRGSHYVYYPNTFDKNLQRTLLRNDQTRTPHMIAVHFTLTHWPYAFASSALADVTDEYRVTHRKRLYTKALHAVDEQVRHLFETLHQAGYLQDALVILLSDHGETLYEKGSRHTTQRAYQGEHKSKLADYITKNTATALDRSAGHGSDLLSPSQYHCLMAFSRYQHNKPVNLVHTVNTRVALIDIAPTLYAFSDTSTHDPMDGISLLNIIKQPGSQLPERAFMLESGMFPNQLLSREEARRLGAQLYAVEKKTGQLALRETQLSTLDSQKLYAIIEGDWVLALYPDGGKYIPVIQRLRDGAWVDDLTSRFANKSPAENMLRKIQSFYGKNWPI